MAYEDTEIGGGEIRFPQTRWSLLGEIGDSPTLQQRAILGDLMERYWKPVYCYLARSGYSREDAKDLVQEFFASWFLRGRADQADAARGRFRTFLLASLQNFLRNQHRHENAQRRRPPDGIASIDQLIEAHGLSPSDEKQGDPEHVFERAWLFDLLKRVVESLRDEWLGTPMEINFEIFRRSIVEPATHGGSGPTASILGEEYGLETKEVQNRLITARRAFVRLLREEVREYESTEDRTAAEIHELFALL